MMFADFSNLNFPCKGSETGAAYSTTGSSVSFFYLKKFLFYRGSETGAVLLIFKRPTIACFFYPRVGGLIMGFLKREDEIYFVHDISLTKSFFDFKIRTKVFLISKYDKK